VAAYAERTAALPDVRRGVRPLELRRRRSRVPWIYLLYHRHRANSGWDAQLAKNAAHAEKVDPVFTKW